LTDDELERARRVQRHVKAAAREHGIDPNLLNAIIWRESRFKPRARNPSGVRGLMQLMPRTAQAMAKKLGRPNRPYDPAFSVHAGAALLSILLAKFDGDPSLALFGYARGSGSARAWQRSGEPMPARVRSFINDIRDAQRGFEALGFPEL
jgi:soluble lytic murein transglycosylase-like protein